MPIAHQNDHSFGLVFITSVTDDRDGLRLDGVNRLLDVHAPSLVLRRVCTLLRRVALLRRIALLRRVALLRVALRRVCLRRHRLADWNRRQQCRLFGVRLRNKKSDRWHAW